MRRHRNVKIVATLGPASSTYEMIRALFEAGADVFRLNMSHGVHDDIRKRHEIIRQVERDLGRPIGILADLQGPKLRVGVFAKDAEVRRSARLQRSPLATASAALGASVMPFLAISDPDPDRMWRYEGTLPDLYTG